MEALLNRILDRLDQLQSDMNALKSEINDIKAKMATKEELAELKSKVNEIEAKMVIKEDLSPIQQAVLETNGIIKNIEVNQERHEQILEVLSKRSIEHEAAIANLRRVK